MTFTNFPNGISSQGVPVLPGSSDVKTGNVFFVDSVTGSNGNKGTSTSKPFATIDYAIGRCTANNGDVIHPMEGHAETLSTASAITADVAGISIIGLGDGANRPTLTFSVAAATFVISAASVTVKNIITKPSIDSVVSPIVVSGADCTLDIEHQDASATVEAVRAILTTATADRLNCKLKYVGFIAGNACVNAIRLVGVDTARIWVDFYGVASTSIVEFHTTACHNIVVDGYFHNNGTSLTANVVDTVTGSTWLAKGWDGNSKSQFSGGTGVAIASDDVASIAAAVAVIDEFHDVPAANNVLNAQINEVIGNKTDTAATGAVTGTDTLVAYTKQLVTELAVIDAFHDVATADAADNVVMSDVIGNKADAAATGAVTATESLMAYAKQNVTNTEAILLDTGTTLPATLNALPQCVVKADGAVLTGDDNLFVIAGGPVRCKIVGVVTTVIGGASNGDLRIVTTTPAATLSLNAAPVAIDNDAAGTIYQNRGATSVFTPSTSLGGALVDPVTVEETELILTPGTVHFRSSAAQTGVIAWYMTYTPLSPLSTVTAAA